MNIARGVCTSCSSVLYSFSRHDFKYCKCGICSIDGGSDYIKYSGPLHVDILPLEVAIYDIRNSFQWVELYDKDGIFMKEPIHWILKDMSEDQILGVLSTFKGHETNKLEKSIIEGIFESELAYRKELNRKEI